jgi:hypothetical protein
VIDGWEVLAAWKQSVGSSVGARTDVVYVNAASVLIKAPCQQTVIPRLGLLDIGEDFGLLTSASALVL